MRLQCIDKDISKLLYSTSNPLYYLSWTRWSPAPYLLAPIPFGVKSVIAQLRLSSDSLRYKRWCIRFGADPCSLCDDCNVISLEHLLLYCPGLSVHRQKCSLFRSTRSFNHLRISLKSATRIEVYSVFYFVVRLINAYHF